MKLTLTLTVLLTLAFIIPSIRTVVAEEAIQNVTIKGKITNLKDAKLSSRDSMALQRWIKNEKHPSARGSERTAYRTRVGNGTFSLHATKLLQGEYFISVKTSCMLFKSEGKPANVTIEPDTASGIVIDLGDLWVGGPKTGDSALRCDL